jgi:hypothetical protein
VPSPCSTRARARHGGRRIGGVVLAAAAALGVATMVVAVPRGGAEEAPSQICHDRSLDRQRTEIDADITVPGFDPALGTLDSVELTAAAVHLDTDARFENTAQSAVTFEEHMSYQATFSSPGGLPSPAVLTGTIERVPMQTVPAFDGTLDYTGASAVTQPSTTRDVDADEVTSSDPAVLAAFSSGPVAFHVATVIGETFMGGGGNIEAQINTYASAEVRVCYEYAPAPTPSTTVPPPTAPPPSVPRPAPPAVAIVAPRAFVFTG